MMKMTLAERRIYSSVHKWIKYHYGKADHCTNKECKKKSNNFAWAKIRGKKYECKRGNFKQLCYPCHISYDITEESRKNSHDSQANTHKVKCKRGHPFTKENTYRHLHKNGNMARGCKKCSMVRGRLRRRRLQTKNK